MRKNIRFLLLCAVLAGSGFALTAAGALAGGMINGIQINTGGIQVYAPLLDKKDRQESIYQKKEESLEAFHQIEIDAEYENVQIETSDSDEYTLSYCLEKNNMIQKEIKDGRLIIKHKNYKTAGLKNINVMWFSMGRSSNAERMEEYITISLPRNTKLSAADIKTDSGDAVCEKIQADSLNIEADYGKVSILDVQAKSIEAVLDSGDLQMEKVRSESCRVENEYGNVTFHDVNFTGDVKIGVENGDTRCWDTSMGSLGLVSEYGSLDLQQSKFDMVQMSLENGDIKCWNTEADSMILDSEYGNIDVQESELGKIQISLENGDCNMKEVLFGHCKVNADYGSVKIQTKRPAADYGYKLKTEYGNIQIGGKQMGDSYASLEEGKENQIEILCESGDIFIQ